MAIKYAPELHFNTKIKIIGVGGAGGNAVNTMINQKIEGVEYIVANTDMQDLNKSLAVNKIQLGQRLTQGLGAGAIPKIGKEAALESLKDIEEQLEDTNMLFIAAGMGGGTGTGAAPVIAKTAREKGILTLGIVTFPFTWENKNRAVNALDGLVELEGNVDTLIVIPNDKVSEVYGSLSVKDAFSKCDEILANAASAVSDIINSNGYINIDFADVKSVMSYPGYALMGSGEATGSDRALKAASQASLNPLLAHVNLENCKGILINITSGHDFMMDELQAISTSITGNAGMPSNTFFGVYLDPEIKDTIKVTIIATGIDYDTMSNLSTFSQNPTIQQIANKNAANKPNSQNEPAFMSNTNIHNNMQTNTPRTISLSSTNKEPAVNPNTQQNTQYTSNNVIDYSSATRANNNDNSEKSEAPSFLKKLFD